MTLSTIARCNWTDTLRLHEVVEKNVDPMTALAVGLKLDADALARGILGKVDLKAQQQDLVEYLQSL